jgi:hypothetical protein
MQVFERLNLSFAAFALPVETGCIDVIGNQ